MEDLAGIAKATNNDIILMVIVLIIGLVVGFIPLYRLILKSKKDEKVADGKEKDRIIEVVERNSTAFTELRKTIESNNTIMSNSLKNLEQATAKTTYDITTIMARQDNMIATLNTINNHAEHLRSDMKQTTDDLNTIKYVVREINKSDAEE